MTSGNKYRFLPFQFEKVGDKYLLVNDVGEHFFLDSKRFSDFVSSSLKSDSQEYYDLKSRGFLWDDNLGKVVDLLATKYRTKKRFLEDFTALHMMVLTHKCNQDCTYCHASSIDESDTKTQDMSLETAQKCVDIIFQSPSPTIKIEFQGGEPTLNFEVIKHIVSYAEKINKEHSKHLEFVLCTNLTKVSPSEISYLVEKNISISTSLDGPEDLHDSCRKLRTSQGTYKTLNRNLSVVKKEFGYENVAALLTVSKKNLTQLDRVVDEYIKLGFGSIFLRALNPFGMAEKNKAELSYTVAEFLQAYRATLEYIIDINLQGRHFAEAFTTILLTKILTPFSTGFVDLQSPAGVGISGVIYDTTGDVYVSDEARMMFSENGDNRFCIGNVRLDTWKCMFGGSKLREIINSSCIESLPGCAWCVYQPYCGADPVKNFKHHGDMISFKPHDDYCKLHKGIFQILFEYLQKDDPEVMDVFWTWITSRSLNEVRPDFVPEELS